MWTEQFLARHLKPYKSSTPTRFIEVLTDLPNRALSLLYTEQLVRSIPVGQNTIFHSECVTSLRLPVSLQPSIH